MPEHVEGVCHALCEQSAEAVARHARQARQEVGDAEGDAWEAWRGRTEALVVDRARGGG